ncbi:MAG: PD-(D/E)XK nuclease family protein, partial [Spirochaetaceae bacterium]|nr:PD-(D/E)XK nuclease family protein [Spirochaetaceae bacterium]
MEQTLETNADHGRKLLNGVTDIIKGYEAQWQKTGEKYNLFKVAGIAHKEVIMCRVLADVMNPQGKHCQGSRYLKSFWETIAPKLPSGLALDIEHTAVTTEYVIDENRRIDITLEDGKTFVPIEVKIWAGDQPKQVADYFAFARTKNNAARIPVLYLTVDGHEPSDFSKGDLGKGDYVRLSFKDDILVWLEACAEDEATKKTVPVRENLKQLIAAIKSLCGKSEDAEMEDAIFKQITKDDDSARAALAISNAVDFDGKAWEAFKGPITEQVAKAWA